MRNVKISFQIMTRAEPVTLVQNTINALIAIKSADDEILIIDNNHTDKSLYEPLSEFCNELDNSLNVHFYHEDFIAGYKAGALNLALELMDERCNYIVVIDSDYQALPWARASIVAAINQYPNHALLQFPQYYRDGDKQDIHTELNHYFSWHLKQGHNRNRALSTGTCAVINKKALIRLGGWSSNSITEDALMGVYMHLNGERAQYIPKVIATGVLPKSLADLVAQRRRWIYGNMQVLKRYPKILWQRLTAKNLYKSKHKFDSAKTQCDTIKTKYLNTNKLKANSQPINLKKQSHTPTITYFKYMCAHFSQLSAWVNFTGVFIGLHLAALIGLLIINTLNQLDLLDEPTYITPILYVLGACYASYGIFMTRRLVAYLKDKEPLQPHIINNLLIKSKNVTPIATRLRAWLVHLNFWELGALSWLPVIWNQKKPFVCTPKYDALENRAQSLFATIAVVPKLLIGLNALTAVVIWHYSQALFICALTILLVKLMAVWVVTVNFTKVTNTDAVMTTSKVNTALIGSNTRFTNPAQKKATDTRIKGLEFKKTSNKTIDSNSNKVEVKAESTKDSSIVA